jgi:hypothetical protein
MCLPYFAIKDVDPWDNKTGSKATIVSRLTVKLMQLLTEGVKVYGGGVVHEGNSNCELVGRLFVLLL